VFDDRLRKSAGARTERSKHPSDPGVDAGCNPEVKVEIRFVGYIPNGLETEAIAAAGVKPKRQYEDHGRVIGQYGWTAVSAEVELAADRA
jgi:hypothetical protein